MALQSLPSSTPASPPPSGMHRYASLAISRASGLMMLLGHVLLFLAEVVAVALLDISLSLYGVALHLQVFYAKRTFITEPAVPIILARIRTAILSKFHMVRGTPH